MSGMRTLSMLRRNTPWQKPRPGECTAQMLPLQTLLNGHRRWMQALPMLMRGHMLVGGISTIRAMGRRSRGVVVVRMRTLSVLQRHTPRIGTALVVHIRVVYHRF